MVLDSIKNGEHYLALMPQLKAVFDFLSSVDPMSLCEGRHDIDGDRLYVNVAEIDLRPLEDARLEVHNRYVDVQVVVSGEETFGWRNRAECMCADGEFDDERDILFYTDTPQCFYTVHAGQFTLLFPEDAHAPMLGNGGVKKLIFKVLL